MRTCILIFLCCLCLGAVPQADTTLVLRFDFNEHEVKEAKDLVIPKGVGTSLVKDRFGNERSALYLHGNPDSYLNLGTSDLLKPRHGAVSLWVNLDRYVYAGVGGPFNPIGGTKNAEGDDFINSFGMYYDFASKRFCVVSHKDSTEEVNIRSMHAPDFNRWYHLVFVFGEKYFEFYIDGELQQRSNKNFEIKYLKGDSVVFGNSANKKNNRWSQGMLDDIRIFHHALSPAEVKALYEEPDPNKTRALLLEIARYAGIVLVFVLIIVMIVVRNRRRLKLQQEQYELQSRIGELEIQAVKNQMNPHFISNCLAAIQDLVYSEKYPEAAQYIARFSFFMRQVLNFADKMYITLSEELNIIRLNVELEQLRFKNEFTLEMDIRIEQTNDILIPSLITQPFIENAIWHGLLPMADHAKARLRISAYESGDSVFVEIEDNGVGRTQGYVSGNSKGTQLVMDKIANINRLMNSNDYRLTIVDLFDDAQKPSGTRVVLELRESRQ